MKNGNQKIQNSGRVEPSGFSSAVTLLIMVFAFCSFAKAQDRITLRDGSEIKGKVSEIGEYEIKYAAADSMRSSRAILKRNVFMITFENGVKEVFKTESVAQPFYMAPAPASHITDKYDSDTSDFAKMKQKKFGGPRVGFTFVGDGINSHYIEQSGKRPSFVQIGWQLETVLFSVDHTAGLIEFVPLIGGFEQGLFLPSLSVLLGLRTGAQTPVEFALGPNFSVGYDYWGSERGRVGLVLAAGTSFKKGNINFPITFAVVPSVGYLANVYDSNTAKSTPTKYQSGWRFTLLVGFNSRKR